MQYFSPYTSYLWTQKHAFSAFKAYLIAEDADGAGWGHLVRGEPGGCELRRDAQNEDLRDGHHGLAGEEQPPLRGWCCQHLQEHNQDRDYFFF